MGSARTSMGLLAFACTLVVAAPSPASAATPTLSAQVRVSGGVSLNVRSGPATSYPVVRKAPNGSWLSVVCRVAGWDKLKDGRYVSDAYVAWPPSVVVPACGASRGVTARVYGALNLRDSASTLNSPVGTVHSGQSLAVVCQLGGESIEGAVRVTDLWDRLSSGKFISDGYVAWSGERPALPWCALTAAAPPPAGDAFVAWAARYARQMKAAYGVPASVTVAQAILESGWGTSALSRDGNNYFGMKCFGGPGTVAVGCRPYRTTECAGACFATSAAFRVYNSAAESFKDHSRSFVSLTRYQSAFAFTASPDQFAQAIHQAGYATSPTYSQDLIGVMHQYSLYRLDGL